LHLTADELATISSATFTAGLFSWIPGLAVDRFGERCGLTTGGIFSAMGMTVFWAVATRTMFVPRDWLVLALSALAVQVFMSISLVTGSVFKLIVGTCSSTAKGAVVGTAKGFVGLGAGAYSVLFEALGRDNDLDCLLMIAFFNVAATAIPALLLLSWDSDYSGIVDDLTDTHYRTMYLGLIGLGILIVGQSLVSLYEDDQGQSEPDQTQFFLLWFVWMAPILSLLIHPRPVSSAMLAISGVDDEIPPILETAPVSNNAGVAKPFLIELPPSSTLAGESYQKLIVKAAPEHKSNQEILSETPAPQQQYTLPEMLCTTETWLLCWTCTILTGGGTVMTNNIGQMSESLRLHDNVIPAALALFCAAQAFSRVLTGAFSDWCMTQYNVPRPYFLIVASIAAIAAHLVLAFSSREVPFVVGVALTGVAFGMVWPLVVLIVGELFGNENLGANYMFYDGFDSAVGTLLISKFIASKIYEKHIVVQVNGENENTCYGEECFRDTHLIVVGLSASCIFTCLCLLKTRLAQVAYVIPSITKSKRKA
jgi:MFS family permease